jgi:general stress protein 26
MAKKGTPAKAAKAAKPNGSVKRLRKLMRDIRIAMLTTAGRDGSLRSRPMMTSEVEFDGNVWFIARTNTGLAEEINGNPRVNVTYANPKGDRYISLTGTASFVHDQGKVKELWSGKHKAWFPEGKRDPSLALLRIDVQGAEYWDHRADSVQLAQFVRKEAAPSATAGSDDATGAGAQG